MSCSDVVTVFRTMIMMEFIQAKQVGKCVRWLPSTKDMYKMLKITLISFDLDGARVLIKKGH